MSLTMSKYSKRRREKERGTRHCWATDALLHEIGTRCKITSEAGSKLQLGS